MINTNKSNNTVLMPFGFWFAANVESREWVDYADMEKKVAISITATWFCWEKPTSTMYRRINLSTYLCIYSTYQLSSHQWIYESNYVPIQLPRHLSMCRIYLPTYRWDGCRRTYTKEESSYYHREADGAEDESTLVRGRLAILKKKVTIFVKKAAPLMRFNPDASTLTW